MHNTSYKRRSTCITCENDQTVPDMVALLEAENEKLRKMNLQLRKALQALVM